MNDWSPFLDLSDRAAFIRTSVAVYMAMVYNDPRFAMSRALEDWERIQLAMREDKEGRK